MIEALQVAGSVVGGVVSPIVAYLVKQKDAEIKEIKQDVKEHNEANQQFKLDAHEKFAKAAEISTIYTCINEIRSDIKKLLERK